MIEYAVAADVGAPLDVPLTECPRCGYDAVETLPVVIFTRNAVLPPVNMLVCARCYNETENLDVSLAEPPSWGYSEE